MKKYILYIMILFCPVQLLGQGKTHHFLVGYNDIGDAYTAYGKGRLLINNTTIDTLGESRKMPFNATQGNISDENGNLLMASNGCWIADATGDTMQGGGGA